MVLSNDAKWWIKIDATAENGSRKQVVLKRVLSKKTSPVHNRGNVASRADDNAETFVVQVKKLIVGCH
jgi:chitodextrinase